MPDVVETLTQEVYCPDEECIDPETGTRSIAEAEGEDDLTWYWCETCGFEFGYDRRPAPIMSEEPTCQLGVPETLRKIGSALGDPNMSDRLGLTKPEGTPVQLGRKPGT